VTVHYSSTDKSTESFTDARLSISVVRQFF